MRLTACMFIVVFCPLAMAQEKNGFDLNDSLVPFDEIHRGGPPRDGIPSIDEPRFDKSSESPFNDNTIVLGVFYNGIARAYPIPILNWHEIVNDQFKEDAVSITYCPLCGSGLAYLGMLESQKLTFGVSGLLYNSDVLLYDRQTHSLWSQIMSKSISGKLKGRELTVIPVNRTSLRGWKKEYPETEVLSTSTGFVRDYERTPYTGYESSSRLYFPVSNRNSILREKEWVIGVEVAGKYKAYPVVRLKELRQKKLIDKIGDTRITITFDENAENVKIEDYSGWEIAAIELFWFAWYAFYPDTEVWREGE